MSPTALHQANPQEGDVYIDTWKVYMPDIVENTLLRNMSNSDKDNALWNNIFANNRKIKMAIDRGTLDFPCPECNGQMRLVTSTMFYKTNHAKGYRWVCENYPNCDTHVGCHSNTFVPLGTPASKELRMARMKCHDTFDILWKTAGFERNSAYGWLANKMRMHKDRCHIACFTIEQCKRATKFVEAYLAPLNRR